MRYRLGAFLSTLVLVNVACADTLLLIGPEVTWSPKTEPSPVAYVKVVNDLGVLDPLGGWQVELKIIPEDGAKGVLQFNSADLPREEIENYFMWGNSLEIEYPSAVPMVSGPVDEIMVGDVALDIYGNPVPSTVKSLFKMDFHASEDAEGVFAIAAIPGNDDGSWWAFFDKSNNDEIVMREFRGVPFTATEPVVIGHVTIQVPEPYGLVMLSSIIVFCTLRRFSRIRK